MSNELKVTGGEWGAEEPANDYEVCSSDGKLIAIVFSSEEDARLIAASKKLYEALIDTLDFVTRHSNRWDGVGGKHPMLVVEAARAALAAARGEDQ